MDDKVIITCALTGAMTVPAQSDAIPITVEQIVEDGVGASGSCFNLRQTSFSKDSSTRPST